MLPTATTHDHISRRAYEIFEARGRQHGHDLEDWLQAERELQNLRGKRRTLKSLDKHPYLAFCPYLPLRQVIEFAEWELGPFESFEDRWADPKFKSQSQKFLSKFVDNSGNQVEYPSLLCRRGRRIDGQLPSSQEIEALETAIAFGFIDENPRHAPGSQGFSVITTDNAEPLFWPIDVEAGQVVVTSGLMVRTLGGGYHIDDAELAIRPPLDLHMQLGFQTADPLCLEAIYKTVLSSLSAPGANPTADQIRTAIGWLAKAWRNTATVHWAERLVFLKTAFEAITGTHKTHVSGQRLRALFEAVPGTTPTDSDRLVWSPAEQAVHAWTYTQGGKQKTDQVTGLEHWFRSFGAARNMIIHQGVVPPLTYTNPSNQEYEGSYVFTAEYLLRAVVKVSLGQLGYPDLWRSTSWRAIKATMLQLEAQEQANQRPAAPKP